MMKSITSGQEHRIAQLVIDRLRTLGADHAAAQRIIARGGELQEGVNNTLLDLGGLRYKDEEVASNYGYPKEYRRVDVVPQTNILRVCFSGVGFADQELLAKVDGGKVKLPQGAEHWFAIPRWQLIGKTYNEATAKALVKLGETRNFTNHLDGALGADRLKRSNRSTAMWKKVGAAQRGDILLVPAQFGRRHRGRSVRRAREVFGETEFGFGAYEVAIMLLTHPERFVAGDDLWVDCAGDEYDLEADAGRFLRAPDFGSGDDRVEFGARWAGFASAYDGAVSGFLPQ